MIRIGGSTFAFGDISLEESCAILRDMGFNIVDVGASGWSLFREWVPQQVVKNIDDPKGEGERISRVTSDHGLEIAELFICDFGHAINHPGPEKQAETREKYTKMAKIAKVAGFKSLMMLPGDIHEDLGQTFEQAFEASVQQHRAMVDIAGEHGLNHNIEACLFSVAHHPDNALRLLDAVPGPGPDTGLRPSGAAQPGPRRNRGAAPACATLPGEAVGTGRVPGQARRGDYRFRQGRAEDEARRLRRRCLGRVRLSPRGAGEGMGPEGRVGSHERDTRGSTRSRLVRGYTDNATYRTYPPSRRTWGHRFGRLRAGLGGPGR